MASKEEQLEEARRLEAARAQAFLEGRKTAKPLPIVVRGNELTVTHRSLNVLGMWCDAGGVVHLMVEVPMKTKHRTFSSVQTGCGQEIPGEVVPSFIPLSCLECITYVNSETTRTA